MAAPIVRLTHNNLDIVGKSNKVCFANCVVVVFFFLNPTVFCFHGTVNRNGHTGRGPGGVCCVRVKYLVLHGGLFNPELTENY